MIRKLLLVSAIGLAAANARAETCPNTIQYANGNYLKYGSSFYHSNGNYLKYGSALYYENGSYLKYGSSFYYPSGNYLNYRDSIYYPNGNYLKYGSSYYYANGNYMKYGSAFYYSNGNYARYGRTLYRPDGSQTPFPLTLTESIGSYGELYATVHAESDEVYVNLNSLPIGPSVQLTYLSLEDRSIAFRIYTGHPGEAVDVTVNGDSFDCRLVGGAPREFTIDSSAARVQVQVKAGYDPDQVRRAIEQALDSL